MLAISGLATSCHAISTVIAAGFEVVSQAISASSYSGGGHAMRPGERKAALLT